jgi:hypothetical protein
VDTEWKSQLGWCGRAIFASETCLAVSRLGDFDWQVEVALGRREVKQHVTLTDKIELAVIYRSEYKGCRASSQDADQVATPTSVTGCENAGGMRDSMSLCSTFHCYNGRKQQ